MRPPAKPGPRWRWDRAETLRYRGVHGISHSATTRARAGLLMVGVTLLMTAWIAGTLPFDAPDEASHYQRALTIVNGAILGPKIPYRGAWLTPLAAGVHRP